jgi:alpha-amylase
MAQGNDAYWHGVFGGLYLAHLRRAVYSHLLTAEQRLQQVSGRLPAREWLDLDGDGHVEGVLRGQRFSVVVDPVENGTVTELACFSKAVNLVDTLARRYEPYHEKLRGKSVAPVAPGGRDALSIHELVGVKEEGLEGRLAYDDHRRSCFIDYALSAMPTLQDVRRSMWGEYRLWAGGPWTLQEGRERSAWWDRATMTLSRDVQDGLMRKAITLFRRHPRLAFRYQLVDLDVPIVGLEFNLCLRDDQWNDPRWQEPVRDLQVRDPSVGLSVTMAIDPPASLVTFPIETVSASEEGLERTYQGLAIVCLWSTRHHRRWSCGLEWAIEDL